MILACDWWLERAADESVPRANVAIYAGKLHDWRLDGASVAGRPQAEYLREYLVGLVEDAAMLPDAQAAPFAAADVRAARTLPERVTLAKHLRQWAAEAGGPPEAKGGEQPAETKPSGMSVQEAADRMERLRSQGTEFTSQHELAKAFGCSSGTINKAIRKTKTLHSWAKRQATPRAQSINPVVTDHTTRSREPDPVEEAARREYLEREDLTPDERAAFNAMTPEDQLRFLDLLAEQVRDSKCDRAKRPRLLGRKP